MLKTTWTSINYITKKIYAGVVYKVGDIVIVKILQNQWIIDLQNLGQSWGPFLPIEVLAGKSCIKKSEQRRNKNKIYVTNYKTW